MSQYSAYIPQERITNLLVKIKDGVSSFLHQRQSKGQPFGHFNINNHAHVTDELDAATAGTELWQLLGIPLNSQQRQEAIQHLKSYQNPQTGLVIDPSWRGRQIHYNQDQINNGDTFFTMTAIEALTALGSRFDYPIRYLAQLTPDELVAKTNLSHSALSEFSIGDYAILVEHNRRLGVHQADEQQKAVLNLLVKNQDSQNGFWPKGEVFPPYTPAINRAFHFLRGTWNLINFPYCHAERMIETCLEAAEDANFYGWGIGEACNDLDLAVVIYSASKWVPFRQKEVQRWALKNLPRVLSVQKEDGGFSYHYSISMDKHNNIRMSPGEVEGDLWGTLMYMGTIKMMVELAYPEISAPWNFSIVHRVPKGKSKTNQTRNIFKRDFGYF